MPKLLIAIYNNVAKRRPCISLKFFIKKYCISKERHISLCRELTKIHEEVLRLTLSEAVQYYSENEPKGEYVLVIEGKSYEEKRAEEVLKWEEISIEEHMKIYEAKGLDKKEAMKKVAKDRGITKRDVYQALLEE